jgi:hypothetical protein
MTPVVKAVLDALLSQGPLGVVVAGMAYWIWRIQTQLFSVQEQRVKDAFRLAETATTVTSALDRNTTTLKALLEG